MSTLLVLGRPEGQFAVRNLSVLSYAIGFTGWVYRGADASLAEASAPGFFDEARGLFTQGDVITIQCRDGVGQRWIDMRGSELVARPLS